ncbi:response regulator transcription factor [Kitasatospora sp. NPDC056181]|uniref:response regulator transcription factor n=1 Tax=Kitasatospora sp. NPDC056181 TaxID=3345737 RepID=UPI0035E31775
MPTSTLDIDTDIDIDIDIDTIVTAATTGTTRTAGTAGTAATTVTADRAGTGGTTAIVLMIRDHMRRYGVEGMFRSLDPRLTTRTCADLGELAGISGGQLIISSGDAVGPLPEETADTLRTNDIRVLILVDPATVVEQSWADRAHGFLDWADLSPETLGLAVADVAAGRFHVSESLVRRSVTASDQAANEAAARRAAVSLTARELQVLRLIAGGSSNRQVARSLGISEHGVKRLVGIVLAKLNCPNRTLAVVRAIESGLLTL